MQPEILFAESSLTRADPSCAPTLPHPHRGLIWVYLNGRCNFHCEYCLDARNATSGRAATFPDFLPKLKQLQTELGYCLIFTGGEPLIELALLRRTFSLFSAEPKSIQTNGSLTRNAEALFPLFSDQDWLSVSLHDDTYADSQHQEAVGKTLALARERSIKVLLQLMCSPANIKAMLRRALDLRHQGYRVALRRLFLHNAKLFKPYRHAIEELCSDHWAAPAFFGDAWCASQPFVAISVYLDGAIRAVCRSEIPLGNLYTGYDLAKLARSRSARCDAVCHCCSCLWTGQSWGFA